MTNETDGLYIGRTEKNKIRLTAVKDDDQIVFHVNAETARDLASTLQSESAKARRGGGE